MDLLKTVGKDIKVGKQFYKSGKRNYDSDAHWQAERSISQAATINTNLFPKFLHFFFISGAYLRKWYV